MPENSPLINSAQLAAGLVRDDVCVIDCRFDLFAPDAGRNAWLEAHIPGAVYADLDKDLAGAVSGSSGRHPLPDTRQIETFLGNCGVDNDTDVVVYDAGNGSIAARAWWMMHWLGHGRTRVLDGGLKSWTDGGNPTESGIELRPAARFVARPRDDMVVTTAELVAGRFPAGGLKLFDARDAIRFSGEAEPIDRVAGHIPGAVNLPFSGNLADDGRFRPPAELAQRLEEAHVPSDGQRWAVMCGSGVTACHLALAAVQAGLDMPALYVGSWSEWISDPDRPVATGD